MASSNKFGNHAAVSKLLQVAGWMSDEEKERFTSALADHPQFKGQSDFIKCAAVALIGAGKRKLAQPLAFLTVEQRDALILRSKRRK